MKKNLISAAVFAVIFAVTAACDPHTHTWGAWEVTKAPTATAAGEETRECTDCGKTDTRPIAKLIAGVDVPKPQSQLIEGLFDNDASATVKGEFLNSEWEWKNEDGEDESIYAAIKTALNARFARSPEGLQNIYRGEFNKRDGITIFVVKDPQNPSYDNYNTTYDGTTIYINSAVLDDTETLEAALHNAIRAMSGNKLVPETAKAISSPLRLCVNSLANKSKGASGTLFLFG